MIFHEMTIYKGDDWRMTVKSMGLGGILMKMWVYDDKLSFQSKMV